MAENNDQDTNQQDTNDAGGRDDVQNLEQAQKLIVSLEKRLGERDERISSLSERLSAIEADRKKTLAEQGNYQQLLNEAQSQIESLKGVQSRMTTLEDVIREGNKALIERIPEQMRGVVPTTLPPEALNEWLNKSVPMLSKPPAPKYNAGEGAGAPTGQASELTAEERSLAQQFGLTEDDVRAAKQQLNSEE